MAVPGDNGPGKMQKIFRFESCEAVMVMSAVGISTHLYINPHFYVQDIFSEAKPHF